MSDWPQRYEQYWDSLLENPKGEYMEFNDFEDLLTYSAEVIQAHSEKWRNVPIKELKAAMMVEIVEWREKRKVKRRKAK
jgi:hypothetical protein